MITVRGVSFFKTALAAALILAGLIPVLGQSNWQGTAVVGRYGEFPPGGYFASSNSFPLNTMVDLTNNSTGESVRVIVVGRVEEAGVFMVLSEAAAAELGVRPDRSGIVRAEPVRMPGLTTIDPNQDLPFHPDPDVNPAATLGDPNVAIVNPAVAGVTPEPPSEAAPEPPPVQVAATPRLDEEPQDLASAPSPPSPPVEDVISVTEALPDPTPPESAEVIGEAPAVTVTPELRITVTPPAEQPDTPDVPLPMVSPPRLAPLTVVLQIPQEPRIAEETPQEVPSDPAPVVSPVEIATPQAEQTAIDPLAQRLRSMEETLGSEQVSRAPLESSPVDDLLPPPPAGDSPVVAELPLLDLSAAMVIEVDPLPRPFPNEIIVTAILPDPEGIRPPEIVAVMPAGPEESDPNVALPIAGDDGPVQIVELPPQAQPDEVTRMPLPEVSLAEAMQIVEPSPVSESEADPTVALPLVDVMEEGDEVDLEAAQPEVVEAAPPAVVAAPEIATGPTRIPDDAVLTLEPAEFRSPEIPDPEADPLLAEEPVETDVVVQVPVVEAPEAPVSEAIAAPATVPETPTSPEEPTRPDPPAEQPAAPAPESSFPLVASLQRGAYYVQVAAMTSEESARRAVTRLNGTAGLPVSVLSQQERDTAVYRIVVGPLEPDERGTALFMLRSQGFRDAFLRRE